MTQDERLRILDDVNAGRISTEEAEAQLTALDDGAEHNGGQHTIDFEPPENAWKVPVVVGLSTLGMSSLMFKERKSLFARLLLVPFMLLGGSLTLLGFWSRSAHWILIHVQNGDQDIKLTLPFPVQFASWVLSRIEPLIEAKAGEDIDLRSLNLGARLREMGDELSAENPLMVAVDEGDTRVLVYII